MDHTKFVTVNTIAHEVREWAEMYAAATHFDSHLCGLCAIASGELHARLKRVGINSTLHLYEGQEYGHCFLQVDDHIVDVTATQFKLKEKVIIQPASQAKDWNWWTSTKSFTSVKDMKKYQRKVRWADDQVTVFKIKL